MHFETKDAITLALAFLGAVLGVINTWQALDQRRVRLRVVPKLVVALKGGEFGEDMGCIEVINMSAFPVSLQEIGFTLGGDPRKTTRVCITEPLTGDRKPFGRTLQPRHAVTGYFDLRPLAAGIQKAYAMTECNEVAYGVSKALKQMRRMARG